MSEDHRAHSLPRREFLGWILRAGAAVSGLFGGLVGFTPSAFAITGCLTVPVDSGPCTVTGGTSACVGDGVYICTGDLCTGNKVCGRHFLGRCARIKCVCSEKKCCWVACNPPCIT